MERRKKVRERKQFDRTLKIFDKLAKTSVGEGKLKYLCVIQSESGEFHFSRTDDFEKKLKDNNPIINYTDSLIETRRSSLIKKLDNATIKRSAVGPFL